MTFSFCFCFVGIDVYLRERLIKPNLIFFVRYQAYMPRLGLWGEGTLFPDDSSTVKSEGTGFEQFTMAANRGTRVC